MLGFVLCVGLSKQQLAEIKIIMIHGLKCEFLKI
mgnify:CR=1 FL=1